MSADVRKTQTIDRDIVQLLRDYKDGKISTSEIGADIVDRLRALARIDGHEDRASKEAWVENKIVELEQKFKDLNRIANSLTKGKR